MNREVKEIDGVKKLIASDRKRDNFNLHTFHKVPVETLSVEERGELFLALFKYADGEEVELSGNVAIAFSFMTSKRLF